MMKLQNELLVTIYTVMAASENIRRHTPICNVTSNIHNYRANSALQASWCVQSHDHKTNVMRTTSMVFPKWTKIHIYTFVAKHDSYKILVKISISIICFSWLRLVNLQLFKHTLKEIAFKGSDQTIRIVNESL